MHTRSKWKFVKIFRYDLFNAAAWAESHFSSDMCQGSLDSRQKAARYRGSNLNRAAGPGIGTERNECPALNINASNCLPILVCNEQDVTYDGQTNCHVTSHEKINICLFSWLVMGVGNMCDASILINQNTSAVDRLWQSKDADCQDIT